MSAAIAWLRRRRGQVVFALTLLTLGLGVANIWRHDLLPFPWLARNKDALAALSSIVTMTALVGGAIFSYYKFFRGRTLSLRAETSLEITVHRAAESQYLHAITLLAKNVGGSTIWNPKPTLQIICHRPEGAETLEDVTDWWEEPAADPSCIPVIDPDETVSFVATRVVPEAVWAVSYRAVIRADQGDTWYVAKTVSNKEA